MAASTIDIVFDGPLELDRARLVEVERDGKGFSLGDWVRRPGGYWALRIPDPDRLRAALAGLEQFFQRPGESNNDSFERVAHSFYKATGVLRPGKSYPLAMPAPSDEEQRAAYEAWVQGFLEAARKELA